MQNKQSPQIKGKQWQTGERADRFVFETPDGDLTLQQMESIDSYRHLDPRADNETAEYIVAVRWLYTVPKSEAFSEVGLFGNQNTACKPTTPKWSHTVNRLK